MYQKGSTRREWIRGGAATAAAGFLHAYPLVSLALPPLGKGETLVPFLDPEPDAERPIVRWEKLEHWITPAEDFFSVQHYGEPEIDPNTWKLDLGGLVRQPLTLGLLDLKARPRLSQIATLECAGNGAFPKFTGAVGNAKWTGTPLSLLLEEAGLEAGALDVVFFGADQGEEKIRDAEYKQNFARSLSTDDALKSNVLLIYEMNGQPLPYRHGGPVRLGVPGSYGVAWVKWLQRIEVHNRRFSGKFMARDYVTIRGEQRGDQTIWRETSVDRVRLKSVVARVIRRSNGELRVEGAAWNDGATPLRAVEIQIDDRGWAAAELGEGVENPYSWTFWSHAWNNAGPGEHSIVSRAVDWKGSLQPTADDPAIKLKKTYWEANQQVVRRVKV